MLVSSDRSVSRPNYTVGHETVPASNYRPNRCQIARGDLIIIIRGGGGAHHSEGNIFNDDDDDDDDDDECFSTAQFISIGEQ